MKEVFEVNPQRICHSHFRFARWSLWALALVFSAFQVQAADEHLLPVRYESDTGKVLLEIRPGGGEMIYHNTLATGLGTASPLLDRGQVGISALVRFERRGPRVLLVRENAGHRALTDDEALSRSVMESFPRSVLAAFDIEEELEGRLLVDATEFFLSDVFEAALAIESAGLGTVELDRRRSYIDLDHTKSFPSNSEIRAVLTFASSDPHIELRRHSPDGRSVVLEQHHSFLALPDEGYRSREFHPRAGFFPHAFFDYAQGLDSDYWRRWIMRWRLEPSDPEAYLRGELVEPVRPIRYYMDPAIPEPYRTAFIEGGLWWNGLFEAAGFRNAFRILDLPEGVDPLDARYNVIYWVHRSRRGPSVGPSFKDPRTGEILKTVVRMDSYRSLVNHDIWMGFLPAAGPRGLAWNSEEMAMARRRQHSAHEIGHTLGLAHNFIAATHDRASVMDYPAPLTRLDADQNLNLSRAYAPGPGAHDRIAIRYGYTWYQDAESEAQGLAEILKEAEELGLRFITGGHAAPAGSFADATVWVEGSNMLDALGCALAVREVLIERFDERALSDGEPFSFLNRRFAHVYLHHRPALEGATKLIGGMEFAYALKGDPLEPTRIVNASDQRSALELVLSALEPENLRIPERVSRLIAPTPFGWNSDEELFPASAGPAFDPLTAAHSLAQEIVDGLLHPERLARVASFHARDREFPSLSEILTRLIAATWEAEPEEQAPELRLLSRRAALDGLLDVAGGKETTALVRAEVERTLEALRDLLDEGAPGASAAEVALRSAARRDIDRYFRGEDDASKRPRPAPIPLPWP